MTALSVSCESESCRSSQDIVNPNGDSELALVMRDLFDQHMVVKEQIKSGVKPSFPMEIGNIHTLNATEPDKVRSLEYRAFAQSYLMLLEELYDSESGRLKAAHNALVESCMNCHTALCPGPLTKIKKLYISQ